MQKLLAYLVYVFAVSAMSTQVSVAEIVTIHFEGTVRNINTDLNYPNSDVGFSAGEVVSGTYSFDTNAPNNYTGTDFSEYRIDGPLPQNIGYTSFNIGSQTLTQGFSSYDATVFVDDEGPAWDGLSQSADIVGLGQCCDVGTLSNGLILEHVFLEFYDGVNNPISSEDLNVALSKTSSFDKKRMWMNARNDLGMWVSVEVDIFTTWVTGTEVSEPAASNLVAFDSLITFVDDPSGQLSPELRSGKVFDGYFTFDPSLPNLNPPDVPDAVYSSAGNEKNHMSLNLDGQNFRTDHLSGFEVRIENREPADTGADTYEVEIPTSAIQLANGSRVDRISLRFINLTRKNLTNTELLASTPTDLTTWYRAYLEIYGQHVDGSPFQIKSSLSSLNPGSMTTIPMATEELFPASGALSLMAIQEFPGAQILFDASRPPIEYVTSMLLNERGEGQFYCGVQNLTWLTNQQILVCPEVKYGVSPGLNVFRVYVRFADGSSKYYMTRWNIVD